MLSLLLSFTEDNEPNSKALQTISDIIGWTYFICWSLSFYG